MKDIYNFNKMKTDDENAATVTKIIRAGSNEYDKIHDGKSRVNIPDYFYNSINYMINDDNHVQDFIDTYINKVNEAIVSGKKIDSKAYGLYNFFRSI